MMRNNQKICGKNVAILNASFMLSADKIPSDKSSDDESTGELLFRASQLIFRESSGSSRLS